MSKHIISDLLKQLPVDTGEAKKLLLEKTGINYFKLRKILANPEYKISGKDLVLLSNFFGIEAQELFNVSRSLDTLASDVMNNSEPIKSLKHDKQTDLHQGGKASNSKRIRAKGSAKVKV